MVIAAMRYFAPRKFSNSLRNSLPLNTSGSGRGLRLRGMHGNLNGRRSVTV
jgi:hypothetical protein